MSSKYLKFNLIEQKPKTFVFEVRNKIDNVLLGRISWLPPWRRYVFVPVGDMAFDVGCLNDIGVFITQLMKNHKKYS